MSSSPINRKTSRRTFAAVPLIGTAFGAGPFRSTGVAALRGSARSVVIPTHEFAGDIDERLDFPAAWDVNVLLMKGHNAAVLGREQIRARVAKPVGTRPLAELAQGKRRVVITFDDLTRTTPTYEVAPFIIDELLRAGVPDRSILFLASYGTHRPMSALEVHKKLGAPIAQRFAWMNHDVFSSHKELGKTSFGTPVKLNQTFLAADLKICISGIKVHNDAGYGGGAKAVMPGVASLESIEYNHNVLLRQIRTAGPVRVFHNEMRQDMIEAARLAQVDFTVQVLYNHKLRVIDVFAGDIVEAHQAGCRIAATHYATPTYAGADIVVANGYPQSAQAFHAQRWIDRSVREGGTGVLIIQHPLGLDPIHFLNNRNAGRQGASYFDLADRRRKGKHPKGASLIVYSQYMDQQQRNTYPEGTVFAARWEDVIGELRARHAGTPRVAVYPYGGMQHQEIKLDG